MPACLAEEDLLALGREGALATAPEAEEHLASCASCSALLASLVRDGARPRWDALAGTHLGPYRLDAQIGEGGMGAVYRAWDERLERSVAIKVLRGDVDAERIAAEARATAKVAHPAIVAVHDVGRAGDTSYIAMELVEGESLRSVIARGSVTVARATEIVIALARALAAAHDHGIVHCDLKPENVLVTRAGDLKLLDFGLAQDAMPGDADATGSVRGTAGYMAPEQARGEVIDARADVFSLGAIAFELVVRRRAFPGATHADRLSATLRDQPVLDGLGALAPIVGRCLAKDRADRFQSMTDLAWALDAIRRRTPAPSRRVVLAAGAGLVAAATGIGGFLLGRGRRAARERVLGFRQLTFRSGRIYTARFTPDGGRIVFGAAWDAEPLAGYVLDLAGGVARPLDVPRGDILAISPHGELALGIGRHYTDHQSATGRLARVPMAGGEPRELAADVQEADFSGDDLAITRRVGARFAIELPIGHAVIEDAGWITHPRVAPDRRSVAYLRHPNVEDDRGSVMLLDLATGAARQLGGEWASLAGLAWEPGGRAVWVTAARQGGLCALYRVALDGATRLLAQTTGRLRLHDVAADGRIAASVDAWRLRTVVAQRGGAETDRSLSEVSLVADISDDGATLLVGEAGDTADAFACYLQPAAGGRPLLLGAGLPLALSPSGERVAIATPEDRVRVLDRRRAGERDVHTAGPVAGMRWLDEQRLVAAGRDGRMWLVGEDHTPAAVADVAGPPVLDGARRRCAFVAGDGVLRVLDVATRELRALGRAPGRVACGWRTAPDAIVLRTATTPLELVLVDAVSGTIGSDLTITPPAVGLRAVDSVVISRDGSLYAYSYGQELSQLWLASPA